MGTAQAKSLRNSCKQSALSQLRSSEVSTEPPAEPRGTESLSKQGASKDTTSTCTGTTPRSSENVGSLTPDELTPLALLTASLRDAGSTFKDPMSPTMPDCPDNEDPYMIAKGNATDLFTLLQELQSVSSQFFSLFDVRRCSTGTTGTEAVLPGVVDDGSPQKADSFSLIFGFRVSEGQLLQGVASLDFCNAPLIRKAKALQALQAGKSETLSDTKSSISGTDSMVSPSSPSSRSLTSTASRRRMTMQRECFLTIGWDKTVLNYSVSLQMPDLSGIARSKGMVALSPQELHKLILPGWKVASRLPLDSTWDASSWCAKIFDTVNGREKRGPPAYKVCAPKALALLLVDDTDSTGTSETVSTADTMVANSRKTV
eukprot:gnl/TRDRNA2_/TRDRNA2_206192_c0_seq1.p1 gnl/TRDRNA2_/TRDRNA2_206192_c0~~gnl/TRDRNA2_/TRDRNA2_206192_c0_seq1.p1  ORF type:complete len:383 (-),score=57.60 gnl/TRDRNA2_/TRDRNA2_206192_c0_seq1:113-1231(-)